MAPLKPVCPLYDVCIESVLQLLSRYLENRPNNISVLRKLLLALLHGQIREQLIENAMKRYSPSNPSILDLVELLADPTLKQLHFTSAQSGFNSRELFDALASSNMTGLHRLSLKVQVDKLEMLHTGYQFDVFAGGLYSALRLGLADNLRALTLHSAADNLTLNILGKQATHLTYLDITSSWHVDDNGICDLLLKDSSNFIKEHWPDLDVCEPRAIHALSLFPEVQRNKTCSTLCEVKIQDTNTSSISVLLLLLFGKCLKSLGGFLYSRNIGDAILTVQSCLSSPMSLELSELWDTQLPFDKLSKLSKYLPKLNTLYTRVACLPPLPGVLPPLKNLTVDFDFVASEFFGFLQYNGSQLKRLVLIDQVVSLPLTDISSCCPVLEELVAKVSIGNPEETSKAFRFLTCAKLRISSPSTFTWIMRNADNLKKLEIFLEREITRDTFGHHVIEQIIKENPKSLQSIHTLNLYMFWHPKSRNFAVCCGRLTIDAAYALCSASSSLRVLGELQTWFMLSRYDVLTMVEHIKKNNWDVQLRFRDALYPLRPVE